MSMDSVVAERKTPAHVPEHLIWPHAIDNFADACRHDPYVELSAELHAGPDIRWLQTALLGRSSWLLTRHAHQQEAMLDPKTFSSERTTDFGELLGVSWP